MQKKIFVKSFFFKFKNRFKSKTGNHFEDRDDFEPKNGKYTLVKLDYAQEDEEEAPKEKEVKVVNDTIKIESKLDKRIKELVKFICNVQIMQDTMLEYQIDVKKMPLGKLSKTQIAQGYSVLKEILEAIRSGASEIELGDLSSTFYSTIPHVAFFIYFRILVVNVPPASKMKKF